MSDDTFHKAMDYIFKYEGGLENNPKDPGGLTNYGIALKSHPDLGSSGIVNLTKDEAEAIYKREYWAPIGGDALAWPLCLIVMDTAVNCGVDKALQFLFHSDNDPIKYLALRIAYYNNLINKNNKLEAFRHGWMNRVNDLKKAI